MMQDHVIGSWSSQVDEKKEVSIDKGPLINDQFVPGNL